MIRPMGVADLDRVVEIADSLVQAPRWAREVYEAAVDSESTPRRVALVAEEPGVGVVAFAVASVVLHEAELETIGVAAARQRKGTGGVLLDEMSRSLAGLGVGRTILEVRESNATAQRLYRSHGFEEIGRRPSYYIDPKEDAILMAVFLGGGQP
jgi:[ribosomal protein S18]-alanine N-acetyltransferase